MKIASPWAAVGAVGCAALLMSCSSSHSGTPSVDAGSGGVSNTGGSGGGTVSHSGGSGGAAPTGGASGTGGAKGSGGAPGTGGMREAGLGAPEAGPDASGAGGHADSGTDASNGLQHLPAYPTVPYTAENPQDANKELLGQILFWDEQIGELDTMACGSCHRAGAGGSDPLSATTVAHLPGPDGVLDANPGITSDDIRGGVGVVACTSPSNVTGTGPQVTTRKPPTYLDAMFPLQIFWDGRAGYCKNGEAVGGCFYDPDLPASAPPLIKAENDPKAGRLAGGALEAQAIGPPVNPGEMACSDQTWAKIAAKLRTVTPLAKAHAIPDEMKTFIADHNSYPKMFEFVYGNTAKVHTGTEGGAPDADDVINTRRIVFAITTHERRLISDQTPWDRWNAGDNSALTPSQVAGFEVFMGRGRCNVCHAPPLFTDFLFHYLGFHIPETNWDIGRQKITNAAANADEGKFKTPSLRNVGLREAGGLLHNGEGAGHDLVSIMNLYKTGGFVSNPAVTAIGIDSNLLPLPNLTAADVDALIDFLRNGLTDPRVKADCTDSSCAPFDRPRLSTEPP